MNKLLTQPMGDLIDALAFLGALAALLVWGILLVRRGRFAPGMTLSTLPVLYFGFAFQYFLVRGLEGRHDQYVDWISMWQIGVTDLFDVGLLLVLAVLLAAFYSYFWFIAWCARRAECAGRSRRGFMLLSAIAPPLAWVIVLVLKPDPASPDALRS